MFSLNYPRRRHLGACVGFYGSKPRFRAVFFLIKACDKLKIEDFIKLNAKYINLSRTSHYNIKSLQKLQFWDATQFSKITKFLPFELI